MRKYKAYYSIMLFCVLSTGFVFSFFRYITYLLNIVGKYFLSRSIILILLESKIWTNNVCLTENSSANHNNSLRERQMHWIVASWKAMSSASFPSPSCVLSLVPLSAPSTRFFSLPPPDTINFKGARETR